MIDATLYDNGEPKTDVDAGKLDELLSNYSGDPIIHMATGDYVPTTTEKVAFAMRALAQSIGRDGLSDRVAELERSLPGVTAHDRRRDRGRYRAGR